MMTRGIKRKIYWFLINHIYAGTRHFEKKRTLLQKLGYRIGKDTKIVGPLFCTGRLNIGENCWIGRNLTVHGNGCVTIGNCCDIAPDVTFQTGGHRIGNSERRAGDGFTADVTVGNGCWIGARSSVLAGVTIEDSCVIAACACVNKSIDDNLLVGGVPARVIRKLSE